jgi:hypothetical protein
MLAATIGHNLSLDYLYSIIKKSWRKALMKWLKAQQLFY